MGAIKSYKELVVWQKSIQLVKEVFILTDNFPASEKFGLTSQMRRCAVSIPSNLAEGFGRRSVRGSSQFYSIAFGSALELETQLIISKDLKLALNHKFEKSEALLLEVLKMLNKLTGQFRELILND